MPANLENAMKDSCIDIFRKQHELMEEDRALFENESEDNLLTGCRPHTLDQQNTAALMKRIDVKYLLPADLLRDFINSVQTDFSVLDIDGCRQFTYHNTYLDTANRQFFADHHNGKGIRQKVRYRRYRETDNEFCEVKLKYHDRYTRKVRTEISDTDTPFLDDTRRLQSEVGAKVTPVLEPSLLVQYKRISMLNAKDQERLTIDSELVFRDPAAGKCEPLDNLIIVEHKYTSSSIDSVVRGFMRKHGIRSTGFSKYCIGLCLVSGTDTIKTNKFRPTLRDLRTRNAA